MGDHTPESFLPDYRSGTIPIHPVRLRQKTRFCRFCCLGEGGNAGLDGGFQLAANGASYASAKHPFSIPRRSRRSLPTTTIVFGSPMGGRLTLTGPMFEIAIHSPNRHDQFSVATSEFSIGRGHPVEHAFLAEDLDGFSLTISQHRQGTIQVTNHGSPVRLTRAGQSLQNGDRRALSLPLVLQSDATTLEIRSSSACPQCIKRMRNIPRTRGPNNEPLVPVDILGQSPGAETLAQWFETLGRLQRSAAGSLQMTSAAVEALIRPGGLDYAMLVMRRAGHWTIHSSHIDKPASGIGFCKEMVDRVAAQKQTIFHEIPIQPATASGEYESMVASPVLGADGSVEGVLYAVRSFMGNNLRRCIRPLEALWVQLVAESITGALIRREAEANATRTRILFEQAFSSKVVRKLLDDPTILQGRDQEISVLFADVRGFTEMSERLGARETYRFLSELLEQLTDCVSHQGGTVIDYYGDGLAAMWNAPTPQPDHALRACRAGLQMLESVTKVSQRWKKLVGNVNIGIGINTGTAQVGNAGTQRRVKYGPRGNTVNVASRVESATKLLGASILITPSTREQLSEDVVAPRIGQVQLRGIREPMELFQLVRLGHRPMERITEQRLSIYEQSLELYEAGKIQDALDLLESNRRVPNDPPERNCVDFFYHYLSDLDDAGANGNPPIFDLTRASIANRSIPSHR